MFTQTILQCLEGRTVVHKLDVRSQRGFANKFCRSFNSSNLKIKTEHVSNRHIAVHAWHPIKIPRLLRLKLHPFHIRSVHTGAPNLDSVAASLPSSILLSTLFSTLKKQKKNYSVHRHSTHWLFNCISYSITLILNRAPQYPLRYKNDSLTIFNWNLLT